VQLKLGPESGGETLLPVDHFCALEWRQAIELVQKVHKSLASLMKVVRGSLVPSKEIAELAHSIIEHKVRVEIQFDFF
jgi:hypothetical protein